VQFGARVEGRRIVSNGVAATQVIAHHARRRRTLATATQQLPATPAPPASTGIPPGVPAVQPVPGTEAARQAAEQAAKHAHDRPHVLLDPDVATRPKGPKVGMVPGMSADEMAGRIVAKLLEGTGPILLCVPGTLGSAYETSMLAIARAFVQQAPGSVSVASIPYPNGAIDCVTRFFHIGTQPDRNVLALVLKRLRVAAPGRPVLLTGESQGAWLIADTLREDPELAAGVSRIAIFAKPGFVKMPASIGSAHVGAAMLHAPETVGVLEYRHTDDIVPSLFGRLGAEVLQGELEALAGWRKTGSYEYPPHHYDPHGADAARWLLEGIRPTAPTVHSSKVHPR
jgi:hypothetical protein